MVAAYEEELKEYCYYDSDSGCGEWVSGEYSTTVILNFYAYDVEIPIDDFSTDNVPQREVAHCGQCDDNYPLDENPMTQFAPGDSVWVCGSCESWYVDEEDAVECCRTD